MNLQRIQRDQAVRIVDFLSGTVYALGGDIQKIGTDIFLCTPDNVDVSGSISDMMGEHDRTNVRGGSFWTSFLGFLEQLIGLYSWALIIYILMSWVPDVRASKFGQLFGSICEPYLEPFRKIIPPIGMIDISPLVAIFLLRFAERGVYSLNNVVGFI